MPAPEATNVNGSGANSDLDVDFNWPFSLGNAPDQVDLRGQNAGAEFGWCTSPFSDISDVSVFREPVWRAIKRLYFALQLAADCECERQEFSVRRDELFRMDLRREELKWLILKNVVKVSESILDPDRHESQPPEHPEYASDSSFVITDLGVELVEQCLSAMKLQQSKNDFSGRQSPSARQELKPSWDFERHELRCGGQVVKKFKWRAANQEMILATFEQEGWPAHIDDPLPQEPDIDPKRRLADAIKSLNRHQKISLVRFCGDGTGQGVLWELK